MENREIEFKYKIDRLPKNYERCIRIRQLYFDGKSRMDIISKMFPNVQMDTINTFRAREVYDGDHNSYVITLKTRAKGLVRGEYEAKVDVQTFNHIIDGTIQSEIIKNRYISTYNKYKFEIDEYLNLKGKLYTLEVELDDVDRIDEDRKNVEEIMKNTLLLEFEDVTFDNRYKNSNLHKFF